MLLTKTSIYNTYILVIGGAASWLLQKYVVDKYYLSNIVIFISIIIYFSISIRKFADKFTSVRRNIVLVFLIFFPAAFVACFLDGYELLYVVFWPGIIIVSFFCDVLRRN